MSKSKYQQVDIVSKYKQREKEVKSRINLVVVGKYRERRGEQEYEKREGGREGGREGDRERVREGGRERWRVREGGREEREGETETERWRNEQMNSHIVTVSA